MHDMEVHVDLNGRTQPVGLLRRLVRGRSDTVTFEYVDAWLEDHNRFALEPALQLTPGVFSPSNRGLFGSIGDSAPDTWGRQLMRRAERASADRENRTVRTLGEVDYLLGVTDVARPGALRFRRVGEAVFQAPANTGVPALVELPRLLRVTERMMRNEETAEDLRLILAPGSSLGGARPKSSVIEGQGQLSIAKFPKESDEYDLESWEEVALRLAERAGIETPHHGLITVLGQPVLLSRRFDRAGAIRIPFLSALAMTDASDGDRGSYPELVDALARHGATPKSDAVALFRRMAFNVLVSNVDDHLRNHGFVLRDQTGWTLSPAYDLNPTPTDVKARILSTNIDLDEGTCSIDLVESSAAYFGMRLDRAREVLREVADATKQWRDVACEVGIRSAQIERMASAFEHDDLVAALAL
ncbi:MAG: type II toxin-antitoxin system HipA family toxin [Gammaproteobacteria bacterium]|nr:type II toxin-antitoxin system HipA family toxin [Gammaproteobacteria bacterium]